MKEIKRKKTLARLPAIKGLLYKDDNLVASDDNGNKLDIDFSQWDLSNVTDLSDIVRGCSNLTNLDLTNWDCSIPDYASIPAAWK